MSELLPEEFFSCTFEKTAFLQAIKDHRFRKQLILFGCRTGSVDLVSIILEHFPEEGEASILFESLRFGQDKVSEFLFDHIENIRDEEEATGRNALHYASFGKRFSMCKKLYARGVYFKKDFHGDTPLTISARYGDYETFRFFREKFPYSHSSGDLLANACVSGSIEICRFIINESKYGINFFASGRGSHLSYLSPLGIAVSYKHADLCEFLLKNGALPNFGDNTKTPILIAASKGYHEICKILVENGADVNNNQYVDQEYNPLASALKNGHFETCRTLIQLGAECTESKYQSEDLPTNALLKTCIVKNFPDMLSFFFEMIVKDPRRFDFKYCNSELFELLVNSFLLTDIEYIRNDTLRVLLKNGADPNCKIGKNFESPLFHYLRSSLREECETLIEFGADVNFTSIKGSTPLYDCCIRNDVSGCRFLIENGVRLDRSVIDSDHSPLLGLLEITDAERAVEILNMLLDSGIYISKNVLENVRAKTVDPPETSIPEGIVFQKGVHRGKLVDSLHITNFIFSKLSRERARRNTGIYYMILFSRCTDPKSFFSVENLPLDMLNLILLESELIDEEQHVLKREILLTELSSDSFIAKKFKTEVSCVEI